jgi:hypothetical protein
MRPLCGLANGPIIVCHPRGAISLSSSSHLPAIVASMRLKPVALPPGRGRLSLPMGSTTCTKNDGDAARLSEYGCSSRRAGRREQSVRIVRDQRGETGLGGGRDVGHDGIAPRVARVIYLFNPMTAPYVDNFVNSFKPAAASFTAEGIASGNVGPGGDRLNSDGTRMEHWCSLRLRNRNEYIASSGPEP